jgi:glycosyltransferase involved in cell wall biosynthesis
MTVSIIIPVYNAEKYIIRCLNSVVSQTFKDLECIIVDDCGEDNSYSLINTFINRYKGPILFKVIRHQINKGVATARNTGIKAASGIYLFFLDSDDTIVNDCIELLLSLHKTYPDAVMTQGNIMDENGAISSYGCHESIPEYINQKEDILYYLLCKLATVPWNRLIKKSFIEQYSIYFLDGKVHEDMLWTYFVAKYANSFAYSNKMTYTYYINENSIMTSDSSYLQILRYSSRLEESKIYLHDILSSSSSNKYQRQYLAVNLLSCLTELNKLKSIKHWIHYWYEIIKMGRPNFFKLTFARLCFCSCLMPPICFFASINKIRWRIQKRIISHV